MNKTINGVQFTSIKTAGVEKEQWPLILTGQQGPDEDGGIINAVDIDWNGAVVDANTTLNTTADLVKVLQSKANTSDIPDISGGLTKAQADELYQVRGDYLTEHQKIMTINNQSLIGEGNITITGGGGNIPTKVSELQNDASYQTDGQVSTSIDSAISNIVYVTRLDKRNITQTLWSGNAVDIKTFFENLFASSSFQVKAILKTPVANGSIITTVERIIQGTASGAKFGLYKISTPLIVNDTAFSFPNTNFSDTGYTLPDYHEYLVKTDSNGKIAEVKNLFSTYSYDSSTSTLSITQ